MSSCGSFNKYCYVCGKYTIMVSRRPITPEVAELYSQYFNQTVIRDVDWAPSIICTSCLFRLNKWKKENILLPPLHIKLGIVKNFIKALNPEGIAFNELKRIFPRLSGMKIKEGILNGPDIRRLMKDQRFEVSLSDLELVAWNCIKVVIQNALGIHRSENFRTHFENMLDAFHNINVRMSLKIHFLHCHVDKFAEQSPTESDEHGERFHQVTARLEHCYSGKKLDALPGDVCWNLQQEPGEDAG